MIFSSYQLKHKILADRYNSIIFKKGRGKDIYLVGGYIRDILRGVRSPDRDYIVRGDLIPFVEAIRDMIGGTIVTFKNTNMVRIVLKNGLTFDFSTSAGTLEEDLSKRDFTINAIAWSPEREMIDTYNGLEDIKNKKIRSVFEKNLISDPLRMVRAYRFAAELNGSIAKSTRNTIKMYHSKVKAVSSERITLELFNLLNSDHSSKYLKMALSDNLLRSILLISNNMLERNIKGISLLEKGTISALSSTIKVILNKIVSQNLTYKGLLCLELLLQNRFAIPQWNPNIKVSNVIRKRLELAQKGIKVLKDRRCKVKDELFDIFMRLKEAVKDVLIITNRLDLFKDYKRFQRIWKKGFLSSEAIITISGIETGPALGIIITELKKAQFYGRIPSKISAVNFIKNIRLKFLK